MVCQTCIRFLNAFFAPLIVPGMRAGNTKIISRVVHRPLQLPACAPRHRQFGASGSVLRRGGGSTAHAGGTGGSQRAGISTQWSAQETGLFDRPGGRSTVQRPRRRGSGGVAARGWGTAGDRAAAGAPVGAGRSVPGITDTALPIGRGDGPGDGFSQYGTAGAGQREHAIATVNPVIKPSPCLFPFQRTLDRAPSDSSSPIGSMRPCLGWVSTPPLARLRSGRLGCRRWEPPPGR